MTTRFKKMHGLGNDFVVIDARRTGFTPTPEQISRIADRRIGVGCDQLIVIESADRADADATIRFYNSDGSESGACGNGTRCVGSLVLAETGRQQVSFSIGGRLVQAWSADDDMVSVDMGVPSFDWQSVPLSHEADTAELSFGLGPLVKPVALNIGNPHVVFFVNRADTVRLSELGPVIERDSFFPERTNVEVVEVRDRQTLRMRVWERGVGITQACGSGACATLVAAARRGLSDRKANVILDGGTLSIEWRDDDHVIMTGPVATTFAGELDATLLGFHPSEGAAPALKLAVR